MVNRHGDLGLFLLQKTTLTSHTQSGFGKIVWQHNYFNPKACVSKRCSRAKGMQSSHTSIARQETVWPVCWLSRNCQRVLVVWFVMSRQFHNEIESCGWGLPGRLPPSESVVKLVKASNAVRMSNLNLLLRQSRTSLLVPFRVEETLICGVRWICN